MWYIIIIIIFVMVIFVTFLLIYRHLSCRFKSGLLKKHCIINNIVKYSRDTVDNDLLINDVVYEE